jgi:transposase-like protein
VLTTDKLKSYAAAKRESMSGVEHRHHKGLNNRARLNQNRRLAKDVEATIENAVTWFDLASVKLMSRRLVAA